MTAMRRERDLPGNPTDWESCNMRERQKSTWKIFSSLNYARGGAEREKFSFSFQEFIREQMSHDDYNK